MKNIHSYIKEYGNLTFDEKGFTEVDNVILSMIPYIPLKDIIPKINEGGITIFEAYQKFKKKHTLKEIKNSGIAIKKASLMFPVLAESKRYQNLILGNFYYESGADYQFGACTITIDKNLMFVTFEGTDDLVAGWLEDFKMSYEYPVMAQKIAIDYLKNITKLFGPNIIVGGHSKGGNLALVSSMNLPLLKKHKLINIYCNDAPGLRKREIESLRYKSIERKLINFIPNGSIVGVILRHKHQQVVKSYAIGPFQHDAFTWEVDNDKFVRTTQKKSSLKLNKAILSWLDKHSDEERKEIVLSMFKIFEEANIKDLRDFRNDKLNNLIKMINASKSLDVKTKDVARTGISLLIAEFINTK